ncbi:MAG TPA: radical SAM protein [Thermoprotei archaeon]|nr:radical SAM protein [TACK group archaeon]HEV51474.1 radical SAM protein [Thermoprotei archaeon]
MNHVNFEEVRCSTCISKSSLGDFTVNPYIGCQHQCAYCYVPFLTHNADWERKVKAKINLKPILARELLGRKIKTGSIFFLSSLTDPYQSIEGKYNLTRATISSLLSSGMRVVIQTKSPLVIRDLDILSTHKEGVQVGFTVLGLDGKYKESLEPSAPSVSSRIKAMKKLSDAGLHTFAFIGPVFPGWTDADIGELLTLLKEAGVREVSVDRMRLRPGLQEKIASALGTPTDLDYDSAYIRVLKKVKEFTSKNSMALTHPFSSW